MALRELLQTFMRGYPQARQEPLKGHPIAGVLKRIEEEIRAIPAVRQYPDLKVEGSVGKGNWANIPWIALMDRRLTVTTQKGVYVVFLFTQDTRRVYLTWNQGVTDVYEQHGAKRAPAVLRERAETLRQRPDAQALAAFRRDWDIQLGTDAGVGSRYTDSTIAHKAYELDALPPDEVLQQDLGAVLAVYRRYADELGTGRNTATAPNAPHPDVARPQEQPFEQVVAQLHQRIGANGFQYPVDDFIAFCAALKAKPFVLLAGISGTGKTKLVVQMARQFGTVAHIIPVRPDWSDSSDLLGFRDIHGRFQPGPLLKTLRAANERRDIPYFICLDEMNLARVEHYFAEFLSVIERREQANGELRTGPVAAQMAVEQPWDGVYVSDNVFLIGTVNMDETTHPFSRKVLDRAHTIEFNHVDLDYRLAPVSADGSPLDWSVLRPQYCRLTEFYGVSSDLCERVIAELKQLNVSLAPAQLQVGYRVRDEACLFVLHAVDAGLEELAALDYVALMKVLPRVQGSTATVREPLIGLWNHCSGARLSADDPDLLQKIEEVPAGARLPRAARKVGQMLRRLELEGYTSYWMQ